MKNRKGLFARGRITSSSGNGGNDSKHSHFFRPESILCPEHPTSDAPNFMGVAAGMAAPFQHKMFEFGRERALLRGVPHGHPEDLLSLKEHATACAEALRPEPYDPVHNLQDAANESNIKQWQSDLEDLFADIRVAIIELEQVQREKANACVDTKKPSYPLFAVVASSLFIASGALWVYHDMIASITDDEYWIWLLSGVLSSITGLGLPPLIIRSKKGSRDSHPFWRVLEVAGFPFGISLLRLWESGFSLEGIFMALALFFMETVVFMWFGNKALDYAEDYEEYSADLKERKRFDELEKAAELKVNRIKERIAEIKKQLEEAVSHRAERISRAAAIPALANLLYKCCLDGYACGLAEIEGRYHARWIYVRKGRVKQAKERDHE